LGCSGDNFENKLTLEKVEGEKDTFKFSFNGWKISYDVNAKQEVKFLGGMDNEVFIIKVKENKALYSDGREFSEEFPLYNALTLFSHNFFSPFIHTQNCILT